jgi:hypothetical protein
VRRQTGGVTANRPLRAAAILAAGAALLLCSDRPARAYFEESDIGVRSAGFSRAFTAIADDASAIHWNAAALEARAGSEAMFTFSKPYAVPGLGSNYFAVVHPFRFAGAGVSWHHVGASDVLSEDMITLALGRQVWTGAGGTRLSLGAALKLARVAAAAYDDPDTGERIDDGSATHLTGDLSAMVRFSNRMSVGGALLNLGSPEFDLVDGELGGSDLPTLYRVGAAWQWNPESTISLDVQKVSDDDTEVNVGGELWFYRSFAIRAGISSDLGAAGGASLRARKWNLDLVALANRPLGTSYRVALRIPFGGGAAK